MARGLTILIIKLDMILLSWQLKTKALSSLMVAQLIYAFVVCIVGTYAKCRSSHNQTHKSRDVRKPMFWFLTWSDTNQAVQLQKMAQ